MHDWSNSQFLWIKMADLNDYAYDLMMHTVTNLNQKST